MIPLAHQTWFEDPPPGSDWGFAGETETLALLAGALLLTLVVRLISTRWNGVDVKPLAAMAPYMPFAVRLHLTVCLVGLLSLGVYLSPAMDLKWDLAGILLGAVMALVAIGMATGYHARAAALLLVAAGPIGMLEFGVGPVIQRIDVLGLALFVWFAGPGRWSADQDAGRAEEPARDSLATAIWCLRVFAGVALIVVAFREKLAYPDYAVQFLGEPPRPRARGTARPRLVDRDVRASRGEHRGPLRPAPHLGGAAAGDRAARGRPIQRHALLLR